MPCCETLRQLLACFLVYEGHETVLKVTNIDGFGLMVFTLASLEARIDEGNNKPSEEKHRNASKRGKQTTIAAKRQIDNQYRLRRNNDKRSFESTACFASSPDEKPRAEANVHEYRYCWMY